MRDYKKEYDKSGFVIIDDFLPKDVYVQMVEIFNSAKDFVEIDQVREDRYKLWETSNDKRFPDSTEDYLAHFWSSYEVASHDYVLEVFSKYIEPIMKEVGGDDLGQFRHQATKIKNNGKDYMRCHYDDYTGVAGYILYFITFESIRLNSFVFSPKKEDHFLWILKFMFNNYFTNA